MRPTLNEPIPPHLIDGFITNDLPDVSPGFEPDAGSLCDYCLALTQILNGHALLPETETTLTGLLCELVWYFAADLNAPRWIDLLLLTAYRLSTGGQHRDTNPTGTPPILSRA
ncbi:hypothetical protein ACLB1N_12375 [Escherichia coli]